VQNALELWEMASAVISSYQHWQISFCHWKVKNVPASCYTCSFFRHHWKLGRETQTTKKKQGKDENLILKGKDTGEQNVET
jgi:hypothetical protein